MPQSWKEAHKSRGNPGAGSHSGQSGDARSNLIWIQPSPHVHKLFTLIYLSDLIFEYSLSCHSETFKYESLLMIQSRNVICDELARSSQSKLSSLSGSVGLIRAHDARGRRLSSDFAQGTATCLIAYLTASFAFAHTELVQSHFPYLANCCPHFLILHPDLD